MSKTTYTTDRERVRDACIAWGDYHCECGPQAPPAPGYTPELEREFPDIHWPKLMASITIDAPEENEDEDVAISYYLTLVHGEDTDPVPEYTIRYQ